jgi:hypothetical protein
LYYVKIQYVTEVNEQTVVINASNDEVVEYLPFNNTNNPPD